LSPKAVTTQYVVQLVPYVKGQIRKVVAQPNQPLKKGDFVKVVGRLQTRSCDDKQTHQKRYSTEVVAWQFVTPGKEPVTVSTTGLEVTDADVPF
jgi:single-stranded DNA-binding protein